MSGLVLYMAKLAAYLCGTTGGCRKHVQNRTTVVVDGLSSCGDISHSSVSAWSASCFRLTISRSALSRNEFSITNWLASTTARADNDSLIKCCRRRTSGKLTSNLSGIAKACWTQGDTPLRTGQIEPRVRSDPVRPAPKRLVFLRLCPDRCKVRLINFRWRCQSIPRTGTLLLRISNGVVAPLRSARLYSFGRSSSSGGRSVSSSSLFFSRPPRRHLCAAQQG